MHCPVLHRDPGLHGVHGDAAQLRRAHRHSGKEGPHPAHCGAAKGQLDTLRLLHNHGGDLAKGNNKGELPLTDAVRSGGGWSSIIHGDKIDMVDKYGKSATRSVDICSILMDDKASVNKLAVGLGGRVSSPQDVAF